MEIAFDRSIVSERLFERVLVPAVSWITPTLVQERSELGESHQSTLLLALLTAPRNIRGLLCVSRNVIVRCVRPSDENRHPISDGISAISDVERIEELKLLISVRLVNILIPTCGIL